MKAADIGDNEGVGELQRAKLEKMLETIQLNHAQAEEALRIVSCNLDYGTVGVVASMHSGLLGALTMRVVDIAPYPDNNWGDPFVIVRVVNARSQFFGSVTAIV
jgi:hypothetical protein